MTNREFYTIIVETIENEELVAHAQAQLAKLDATAEKRKGKVSAKDQAKRDENAALATHIAHDILTTEPKTATDVAAILTAEAGADAEPVKVQKASYLLRLAVDMELAAVTEVKIPKKGTQKAYTAV